MGLLSRNKFTTPDSFKTNQSTGHDCVVYIVNPKSNTNTKEAIVAGYSCGEFGNYGDSSKNKKSTSESLNIRKRVVRGCVSNRMNW